MSREMEPKLKEAIKSHYAAIKAIAEANLQNYFYNSAGIGEHPDITEECIKLVGDVDHANSCLETLENLE